MIEKSQPLQPLPAVLKRGPSRKSASRVWSLAMQCRHRQTARRALRSFLMELSHSSLPARALASWFHPKEISCSTAPLLSPLMKILCSVCARREACEMASSPHVRTGAASGSPAVDRPRPGTRLLIAAQWSLVFLGVLSLIGMAVAMASTPEAWSL